MTRGPRIVYSLDTGDVQSVAEEELGRELTRKEMKLVETKLGDHIDWFGAIATVINQEVRTR